MTDSTTNLIKWIHDKDNFYLGIDYDSRLDATTDFQSFRWTAEQSLSTWVATFRTLAKEFGRQTGHKRFPANQFYQQFLVGFASLKEQCPAHGFRYFRHELDDFTREVRNMENGDADLTMMHIGKFIADLIRAELKLRKSGLMEAATSGSVRSTQFQGTQAY